MNQRWSYSAAEPAAYKSLLALQASVDKSSLEKDLMHLVWLHISRRKNRKCTERACSHARRVFARPELPRFTNFEKGEYQCTHE